MSVTGICRRIFKNLTYLTLPEKHEKAETHPNDTIRNVIDYFSDEVPPHSRPGIGFQYNLSGDHYPQFNSNSNETISDC